MNDIVYDLETYPNCFTFAGVDINTGERYHFEISDRKNQLRELVEFIHLAVYYKISMIGFNNVGFDYPIIHFIMTNLETVTVQSIYDKANSIINTPFENRFVNIIWESDQIVPQIDLYKIHHFDNIARSTSLKELEFNMRMNTVEDLPFPPGTYLTDEQKDELIIYNDHDVDGTLLFYNYSKENLAFRRELSEQYGKNVMNFNDTKIGKDFLITQLEMRSPGICYDKSSGKRKMRQTFRKRIHFKDVLLPYLRFEHPEMQRVHDWFYRNSIVNTKGELDVEAEIRGFKFVFGTGGIHGSVSPCTVLSDDQNMILDIDVTSFYPMIAIANGIYPEHLSELFCQIYREVFELRKKHKKGTAQNAMLKLALNGTYGDSNNVYSPLYDPQYTMAITVNGQLMLCMLAEALMRADDITMLQVNTDGLTIKCPRYLYPWVQEVMNWWQNVTRLSLESVEYKRMWIRDVNNYIAEDVDGKMKRLSAYAHETARENPYTKEIGWHKDHSALVIPKAAEACLAHGTDVRTFVENHDDVHDFLLRTKVNRNCALITKDWKGNERQQQNVSRYYVSMIGDDLIKLMPPLQKTLAVNPQAPWRRIAIQAGYKVKICNNVAEIFPDDIEYEWYIKEANKLVNPILRGGVI